MLGFVIFLQTFITEHQVLCFFIPLRITHSNLEFFFLKRIELIARLLLLFTLYYLIELQSTVLMVEGMTHLLEPARSIAYVDPR